MSLSKKVITLLLAAWASCAHAETAPPSVNLILDCTECPKMVVIPAGNFVMGSNTGERDERPAHRVTISKSFAMSETEITQVQWRAVMQDQWRTIGGKDPSYFASCGDDCPVEQVSWNEAQIFIQKLSARTRKHYRLPTEAEWEYACRAGGKFNYCGSETLDDIAWHSESIDSAGAVIKSTMPVAHKKANAFGLFDMNGNVWEWVEDSYHDTYLKAPNDGDAWQSDGKRRVLRGGSWFNSAQSIRASKRFKEAPTTKSKFYGLRVVRVL